MNRILLDTQVFIQAYLGPGLPKKVQTLLADPYTDRVLSVVSIFEIAVKNAAGKIAMKEEHVHEAVRDLGLTIIPISAKHVYRMFSLPVHHRDPFDRLILATALSEELPLVGGDRQFKRYRGIKIIW